MPEYDLESIGALRVRLNRIEAQLGELSHTIVALRTSVTRLEARVGMGPRGRSAEITESTGNGERAAADESTDSNERAARVESTETTERS